MPNWSFNALSASDEVLKQIVNENGEIDFNKVKPMPEELVGTVSPTPQGADEKQIEYLLEKYGSSNWYDWSLQNWGCKWNGATDDPYEEGDGIIHFRTAWSYPDAFILSLSQKFPDEEFEFEWEEEQGFGQVFTIKNGDINVHEEWDLPEWGEEHEVEGCTIQECLASGGRYDKNIPKWNKGKFYVDQDEGQEYDSLDEAKAVVETMNKF